MKLIILAMIGICSTACLGNNKVIICDFENQKDISQWQKRATKPPVKWTLNTDKKYISSGKGSARFESKPATRTNRWPAVLWFSRRMPFNDWRGFTHISFDVFNPGNKKGVARVIFKSMEGIRGDLPYQELKPGWNKIRVELPYVVRNMKVREMHIFQSDNPDPCVLYFDNLALEADPEQVKARAEYIKASLKSMKIPSSVKVTVKKIYRQADLILKKLKAGDKNVVALARQIPPLNDRLEALQKDIEKKKSLEIAKKFTAKFKKQLGYGWKHGAQKIYRSEKAFDGELGGEVKVSLAKNETEGVQLVLRSGKKLTNVQVSIGDLKSKGNIIASSNIKIAPVGYVKASRASFPSRHYKWTPDPLLTFLKSFTLDANVWQPVYIDVHAPAKTPAGVYRGTVKVTADGVDSLAVPIAVKVWNFSIPSRSSLPTAITYGKGKVYASYKNNDPKAKDLAAQKLLLAHKVTPTNIYQGKPTPIADLKRWKAADGGPFNIFYVTKVTGIKKGQPYPSWRAKYYMKWLEKYVPQLKAAGLYNDMYLYSFDEIYENQAFAARNILSMIKKKYPEIPIMTTAYDSTFGKKFGLEDCVDIWVPLTPVYVENLKEIKAARKKGKKVWWYVCCGPRPPSANLLLESATSSSRLLTGFLSNKYKPDGFLYYQTTNWISNRTVYVTKGPLTEHTGRSAYGSFNGDGMLLYPGKDGVIPTLRLKALRDGLEDYEYYRLLEKFKGNKLLNIPEDVCKTITEYDHQGDKLIQYREQLGNFLSENL